MAVFDRPVDETVVPGLHLKIARYETEAGGEPMPDRAAVEAFVGAGERQRTFLDQITLIRILPVAETSIRVEGQHRRPTGIHLAGIGKPGLLLVGEKRWRIRTFRH